MKKRFWSTTITSAQVRKIDLKAQERYGLSVFMLMENAGRAVAAEAESFIQKQKRPIRTAVICGKGNNGGDGLVAGRHLLAGKIGIDFFLVGEPSDLKGAAGQNLEILLKLKQRVTRVGQKNITRIKNKIGRYDLIIDALFGVGLKGEVRGVYRDLINSINASRAYVISVDVPSGMDADTGRVLGAAVKAEKTITFVAAKSGMFLGKGRKLCGEIRVKNLGIPL